MENKMDTLMKLNTFADFCAGIGGFRIAMEGQGFSCSYTAEFDSDCISTYNKNYGDQAVVTDVMSIVPERLPDFDVLCAGFPCQPYSIAGKMLGVSDSRFNVLPKLLEITERKRPKVVLFENVENFRSIDAGSVFAATCKKLTAIGYQVTTDVLDASRFGVPQQRRRLFIVAIRNDLGVRSFEFPIGSQQQTSFRAFIEQGDNSIPISEKWHEYIDLYSGRKTVDELSFMPPKTRVNLERSDRGIDLQDCIFQMRSSGIRAVSLDKPLPTFAVSISGGGAMIPVYSKERRHLNLTEMKRLMGFPDSFEFPVSRTSAVKQLANAVAPPVISAITSKLLATLTGDGAERGRIYLP